MLTPKIQKLKNLEKQEDIIQKQKILLQKEIQEDREFQKKIEENNSILNLKTLLKKNYKIIQNKNLPNNYSIVLYQLKRDYQKKLQCWHHNNQIGKTNNKIQNELGNEVNNIESFEKSNLTKENNKINICDFIKNIESVDKNTLSMLNNKQIKNNFGLPLSSNLGDINYYKEKIYYDFLPMFATMIGIIENQEKEINKLKMKIEK